MAVEKIDYEDKIGLQNDPNVPDKNKVLDGDMNEIKSVVNNNADELTTAQQNIENLQTGQGTASTDITSLKNRVTTLETDNTTNKADINTLKTDNETNKSNIATLQTDNETNKTNINTLQEDVEEVEGNIQEIQQEQTAQNQKIQELDDNQIHITTEKSDNLNIQDCSGQNAKINVFGISKQETRSGKNKFNIDDLINITDQSAETGSFVASNLYGTTIINNTNLVNLLKPNTNYKCIANVTLLEKPATITSNIANMLTLYKSIAPSNNIPVLKCSNTTEKNNWQVNETKQLETTFTTDNDLSLYNMLCYCYANDTEAGGKFKFENIMILEATEQDETFEQYGASPSPEFPSEIENVTGNIDITVCNKNRLKLYKYNSSITVNGVTITINQDGTIKLNGTATAQSYIEVIEDFKNGIALSDTKQFELDTSKKYMFSIKKKSGTFTSSNFLFALQPTLEGTTNIVIYLTGQLNKLITNSDGIYRGWLSFASGSIFNNFILAPQIEEGETETDCILNEQQIITFPLAQGQKLYKGDYPADDGIHHKRKQIELDGTENWILSGLTTNNQYILTVSDIKIIGENNKGNLISSHFKEITGVEGYNNNNINGISGWGSTQIRISLDISIINRNVAKFKNWLAQQKTNGTPVVVEYPLAEEETEAYTEEQQEAHNQSQNAKTYKTVTNVFTDNAEVEMNYIADTKTYVDNEINSIKNQLNTINELLSTTTTSAMLLDNMQTDLESEVL